MASQSSDSPITTGPNRITFELERINQTEPGWVLVVGRWFGVRGRRFVRPTLTISPGSGAAQLRALADLEHKPWAAQDGESWTAKFAVEFELAKAEQIELSVAPDIAVELGGGQNGRGATDARGSSSVAAGARTPRVRDVPAAGSAEPAAQTRSVAPARPTSAPSARQVERLLERLEAAHAATERERNRRQDAQRALEDERSESLRLRAGLGRLRAELDLALAARAEASAEFSELDATRSQVGEAQRRLQAAIAALERERADSARLRRELSDAEATAHRLSPPAAGSAQIRPVAAAATPDGTAARAPTDAARSRAPRAQPGPLTERPLNPSLHGRTNWLGRLLALVVIMAAIVAILLLIRGTVA